MNDNPVIKERDGVPGKRIRLARIISILQEVVKLNEYSKGSRVSQRGPLTAGNWGREKQAMRIWQSIL